MTSATENPGSKVGRARRKLSQLWQAPAFLLGLFVFLGVAVSAPWRTTPQARDFDRLLASLRAGVAREDADTDLLVAQAETALSRVGEFRYRAAETYFLAGSAFYRQGRKEPAAAAKHDWPRAIEQLEQAQTLGVPDADRPALQYRLGYALLQQNQDVPHALELMMLSVEKAAEQPLAGYQLLVDASLKQPKANLDIALPAIQRILDLTPPRDVDALSQARLQQAEILLRKEQRAEAIKVLGQLDAKTPRPIRVKARLLQARCLEEDGHWDKAIAAWKDLLSEASGLEGGKARIEYQLGLACLRTEPRDTAEAVRAWSDALSAGGLEGQAAGLRLGELRLSLGEKESAQALADWKKALHDVNKPDDYRNPYVELKRVREWFEQAMRRFQDADDLQKKQEVARLYGKIAAVGSAEIYLAEAEEALAKQMAGQGTNPAESAAQFHRAGDAFEHAAKVRPAAERAGLLWRGGQCYLSAKDWSTARKIFEQYVEIDKNEPEAWCILGDLYRAQGQKELSSVAYYKCMECNADSPFATKARYFLALEKIDKKNLSEACTILKQNVDATGAVDRAWQEKSLYKLATVLMQMKKYEEASIHLNDYLKIHITSASALPAREQLGECYRMLADKEFTKEKETAEEIRREKTDQRRQQLEDMKRIYHNRRMELLREGIACYERLKDDLRGRPLNKIEEILMRRALFGIGECHLDADEFFEAKEAFRDLQVAHRRTLESFYASWRICKMVGMMPVPKQAELVRADARESLRLLTEDLQAMPADHEVFRTPGVASRAAWLQWCEATQKELDSPRK